MIWVGKLLLCIRFRGGRLVKIRILGVPLDLGQERRGVDMGPSAVRAAGLNQALKNLGHRVEDAGNIHVRLPEEQHYGDRRAKYLREIAETSRQVAQRVYQTLEAGYFLLSLGGDHSVAVGTQAGVSKFYRDREQLVGCLWIDAHADMNTPGSSASGNVHGMPLAATLGRGSELLTKIFGYAPKIPPQECVLIGARAGQPRAALGERVGH
jgi:arginase